MKALTRTLLAAACLATTAQAQAHDHQAPAKNDACAIEVEGQPGKKFSPDHIVVPKQCEFFTVTLKHVGHNSKEKAGHNWVLTRSEDINNVMLDGMRAGPTHDWLVENDGRVLAKTPMLGGQETASVTFPVNRLQDGQQYTYYCSFPAHAEKMRGTLVLGK